MFIHLLTVCGWFCPTTGEVSSWDRDSLTLKNLKYLLSGSWQKKFAGLWLRLLQSPLFYPPPFQPSFHPAARGILLKPKSDPGPPLLKTPQCLPPPSGSSPWLRPLLSAHPASSPSTPHLPMHCRHSLCSSFNSSQPLAPGPLHLLFLLFWMLSPSLFPTI